MKGLGYTPPTYQVGNYSSIAATVKPAPAPTPAPTTSLLDKILNIGTKVTDFANKGVATYQNISSVLTPQQQQAQAQAQAAAGYQYNAGSGGGPQPNQSTGMSTWAKVGIGLGAAALVATLVVVATRGKKKGMGGLGDLNTAKTKSGKVKQRAAVRKARK